MPSSNTNTTAKGQPTSNTNTTAKGRPTPRRARLTPAERQALHRHLDSDSDDPDHPGRDPKLAFTDKELYSFDRFPNPPASANGGAEQPDDPLDEDWIELSPQMSESSFVTGPEPEPETEEKNSKNLEQNGPLKEVASLIGELLTKARKTLIQPPTAGHRHRRDGA